MNYLNIISLPRPTTKLKELDAVHKFIDEALENNNIYY
jgi:hypothetical protein